MELDKFTEFVLSTITIIEWFSVLFVPYVGFLFLVSLPFYFAMKKVEPNPEEMSVWAYGPSFVMGTMFAFLLKLPLFIKKGGLHDVSGVNDPFGTYGKFWGYYATKVAPIIGKLAILFFILLKGYLAMAAFSYMPEDVKIWVLVIILLVIAARVFKPYRM